MSASRERSPAPAALEGVATIPNAISALRLASVPVFVWLFAAGRENAGVVVYGVGAGTDWLDGYIARRTGAVSELGKLLDPLADRIYVSALALALLLRGALPPWLAAAVVGRDVVLLSVWPLLERRGMARIAVTRTGKSATALLLFGLTWLALSVTTFGWGRLGKTMGLPATVSGAVLYWVAGAQYARRARELLSDGEQGASR